MSYFVEDLLEDIKLKSLAPIGQGTFEDADLLAIASKEMNLKIVSDLISIREDFFQTFETVNIQANISRYAIPSRAIGNAFKTLFYIDPQGKEYEVVLGSVLDRPAYSAPQDRPQKFYFEGDEIVLLPTPPTVSGKLKFQYPGHPSDLTLTENCGKIQSVGSDLTTANFVIDRDLRLSMPIGTEVDFVSGKAPFKNWAFKVPITNITENSIEVSVDLVKDEAGNLVEPQVGDYICPTGYSNIPQIPLAYHPVLAQMVVCVLMAALGDGNKKVIAENDLAKLRADAKILVKNRVETQPQKVSNRRTLVRYFR